MRRCFQARNKITKYVDENRIGDHICYYSDLAKIKNHYPEYKIINNEDTIQQIVQANID